jgi:hypothetical protein
MKIVQWVIRDWLWLVVLLALAANAVRQEFRIVEMEERQSLWFSLSEQDHREFKEHRRAVWDHFAQLGLMPPTPVRP